MCLHHTFQSIRLQEGFTTGAAFSWMHYGSLAWEVHGAFLRQCLSPRRSATPTPAWRPHKYSSILLWSYCYNQVITSDVFFLLNSFEFSDIHKKTRKTVDWYSVWNWVSVAGFRIPYNISWKGTMISVRGRERGREIFQHLIIAKLVLLTLHGSTS